MTDMSTVTLYSGGHRGTEAEFGKNAQRWGIAEVNFSFEGHQMERDHNVQMLDEEELKKGDISMEIVSRRMSRTYARAEKIRRVIQLLFHIVNKGYHVLAVGWIQPDNTVKGGTGWGVELGKLFNRPINVFDQEKNAWFAWVDNRWVPQTPTIDSDSFSATGTRNLTEAGTKAIAELFQRSFGTAKNK